MHSQQVNHMMSYYAKLLLIFSLILIAYGIGLQANNHSKLGKETRTIAVINPQDDSISITPIDGTEVVSNSGRKSSDIQENIIDNSNPTMKESNQQLRKEIQNAYNISILYGSETKGYKVPFDGKYISTYEITDETTINTQLNKLKNVLSLYPKNLFKEINDGGMPLTIYLINNYSDSNITGITDSNYQYANISIAAIYSFEESFYHESYHYIERYLLKKGASFNSWSILNPKDFHYGTTYNNLSYSNTFSESAPFVNNYAQTSAGEDRASTFEYMMASSKASCLNEKNTVWSKAKYMALTIETVLESVSPKTTEYWERYL